VARIWEKRGERSVLIWGKLKEKDELEDQGVDKITLILIFTWCAVTTFGWIYLA